MRSTITLPGRAGRTGGWLSLVVVAGLVAGCVGSSGTSRDYARKARRTVDQVHSAVVIGEHVLDLAKHGDATGPYLSVMVGEAETDAIAAQSTFGSVQPPNRSADDLRSRTLALVDPAVELLTRERTLVRRNNFAAAQQLTTQLRAFADELDRYASQVTK